MTLRYASYVESYASFLVVALLQVLIAIVLLIFLIIRRILVLLKVIPTMELESVPLLVGISASTLVVIALIVPEGSTIVFSENPRLGNKSIWISTLFLAAPLLIIIVSLAAFLLFPAALNHHVEFRGKDDNVAK